MKTLRLYNITYTHEHAPTSSTRSRLAPLGIDIKITYLWPLPAANITGVNPS